MDRNREEKGMTLEEKYLKNIDDLNYPGSKNIYNG